MGKPHKYEERDPSWTHNLESRYQRGLLFGKKGRPSPRLGVVAIADLGTIQHPTYAPHPTYDGGIRQIDLKQCIESTLETLTPREEKVVRYLFGIGVIDAHTLAETSVVFDVGPERIRQIYQNALRKLRHPARSKYLKDFLVNA